MPIDLKLSPAANKGGTVIAEESFKRKLATILSAEAVGYSRLMSEDEAKAMASEFLMIIPKFSVKEFEMDSL